MKKNQEQTERALSSLDDFSSLMRGLVDEARVQAHLAVMEMKEAGPYLAEVTTAARAAAGDLQKRSRALKQQLARLRTEHAGR